ncbi:aminotransferase class V-fold PLP-dependent enzyme [Candidatus Desantisbacteria bacterium]|nr:aminotransferase class V-fold PLP-dependent enzyme [Candidatus Desantisbacteria bacterium]
MQNIKRNFHVNIYLDNAATSFPKPETVYKAIDLCLRYKCGNPGRSGHKLAMEANHIIFNTREQIGDLFGILDISRIIFTSNATEALNLGIKGLLKKGDHAITSTMEHNSVLRPLHRLEDDVVISVTRVKADKYGYVPVEAIKNSILPNTKLIVITHASNVVGTINPIDGIGETAKKNRIIFMVDASQTAGALSIDVKKSKIDILACSGHKNLFGPQGTGFIYINHGVNLLPLIEGGTGTDSKKDIQPKLLTERFESGTLNTPGIAGLGAGIAFIKKTGIKNIREKEILLTKYLLSQLKEIEELNIYGLSNPSSQMPVISFNIKGMDSGEFGTALSDKYNIMTRVGLHCAPLAHKTIKTFPQGTIRMSMGFFTTEKEIDFTIKCIKKILKKK